MGLTSKFVAISAATALLCAAAAVWILRSGEPAPATAASGDVRPVWTEIDWPFGADPWGKGKAFRCKAADCGGEVQLYVRAKLGFCNCATGVADDVDLERMGDLPLIGKATPIGAGREIIVGPMGGRSRAYRVEGNRNAALSLAFNARCDMVAATALVGPGAPASLEPAVLEFLNSDRMLKWAENALGL
ncbi:MULTISPECIES: hypothetical protein [unclassified Bradyrhizobium]|uniref:hypothetical protein n=1 Tax=unclassified Bradyrhizobium TaxID=2631580 RepID=UPI00244CC5ED|nr:MULTISPECIES: hypothetical protein [unclassified Bradyrhizobium]MDH2341435.1 hypothetical protein [Bradyrhizobium sp. SSUT77]MDH2354836.1 hypothetical protein [Bradyrhizobium sp. SSUT112]